VKVSMMRHLVDLKKLWNKVLADESTVMESIKVSQIIGTKWKKVVEISLEDKIR